MQCFAKTAADIMKYLDCAKKDFGMHISYSEVYLRKQMTITSRLNSLYIDHFRNMQITMIIYASFRAACSPLPTVGAFYAPF